MRVSEAEGQEYHRLAIRSKNLSTFRRRIRQAKKAYSAAFNHYRSRKQRGAELRCRAWIPYLRFFLAMKASTKKQLLDQSWRLTKLALQAFRKDANDIEFANTYDQLATSAALGYDFHWNPKMRAKRLQEGIDYGRQAVTLLSPVDHKQLLTRIYVRLALFLDTLGDTAFQYDQQEKLDQEALEYWRTAEKLDKKTALLQAAHPPLGFYRILNDQEGAQVCNDALTLARDSGDNFAVGWQLDQASTRMFFEAFRHIDDAEKTKVAQKALRLAEEAQYRHSLANFVTPNVNVLWAVSPYVEHFKQLSWFQHDPAKRRALLEKARSETLALLRLARSSGYPKATAYSLSMAGTVLADLAEWTADPEQRRRLLQGSLKHRSIARRIVMQTMPDAIETVSLVLRGQGELKASLADLEPNYREKVRLFLSALEDKERGVELYSKYLENISRGRPHILHRIGGKGLLEYGDLLTRLYNLTKDERLLAKMARAYSNSAATFKQGGSRTGLGLAYWKAAEAYDLQQANTTAAEYFGLAAKTYQSVKEQSPEIVSIYQDYAKYMEAWSNIEQAKAAHKRLAHDDAQKLYGTAAALHRTAGRWSLFAPYYEAFAQLESAENLSRAGDLSAAIEAFGKASERFRESAALLKGGTSLFNEPQEKASIERLASSFNEEYCRGRKLIEEARQAEDQGDHHTSAERFDEAARVLRNAVQSTSLKREKRELLYISTLAKAWREIARSYDMKDSTLGFRNAISLFEKSLDYSPDENARNVSVGHKYFCEALAASDEFTCTVNPLDYESAAKRFTAASTHFARAGFNLESTHVQACKLLLDAHSQVAKSSKNPDLAESTSGYLLASKILSEAADAFAKSHQTAKQRQVLSLLDSVNERQGFSKRLVTTSKTVSRVSPTVAFPTPAGGEESPVGHARFTGSNIDVSYNSSTPPSSKKTGEIAVELRVVNIGTTPIQVVRIENVAPDTAQVTNISPNARVAKGSMIPVPKKTASMNVETFQFILDAGNVPVIIKPKVVYLDEKGREQSHELPEKVIASSPLLDYLAREFITDYREKGLALQHSGWRTLTRIVTALKVPRSQLYGDQRYGHVYGRPLKALIKSGIVECRTFPGERGRGGQIQKARLAYETEIAKLYLREKEQSLDEPTR